MAPAAFFETMHTFVTAPPGPVADAKRRRHKNKRSVGEEQAPRELLAALSEAQGKAHSLTEPPQVDWMIQKFKTMPCKVQLSASSHDHRCCPYFHSERDRRRTIFIGADVTYASEPCVNRFDDQRPCAMGDTCHNCHSTAELLYHPDLFKKRLCHQFRHCPRGKYCAFAHTRQELLVPHFSEQEETSPTEEFIAHRFKTQWCPIGGPHDWESCVYAHTFRDWRRIPLLGYSSHPCQKWSTSISRGSPELDYGQRCPHGVACPLAHGAKEQLYHPQFYKTSPCSDPNCRRGPLCAFTHGEEDTHRFKAEDPTKVTRKPIAQAQAILGAHQPTFATPPMYHALEDAPKSSGSKTRRHRGRSGRDRANGTGAPHPGLAQAQQQMRGLPMGYPNEVLYTSPYQLAPYMWSQQQAGYAHPMPDPMMFWGGQFGFPGAGMLPMPLPPFSPHNGMASPASAPSSSSSGIEGFFPEVVNLAAWREKIPGQNFKSNVHGEGSVGWRTLSSFGEHSDHPASGQQSAASTPRSVSKPESTVSGTGNSSSGTSDPSQFTRFATLELEPPPSR